MTKISDALTYGLTIRESANDGSDFTNPASDYRRLFLGEDGQLHVKDSAGAVTDIGAGTGNVAADAIWDAKGDLAGGTGANTAAKLTVGANDALLKAASGETTGLKWGHPVASTAKVATSETTGSGSFADLATPGPSVTVTVPASGKVKVTVAARMQSTGAYQDYIGVDISGANTVAAATILVDTPPSGQSVEYSRTTVLTGLSTGSTTFKMQYATSAGTATFLNRELIVELVD